MTDTPHDPGSSADAPAQAARPSPGAPNNAIEIDSSQSRPRWSYPWFFLAVLCALLMGYALGGRGFAYIGVGKLYIGEVVFTLGVVAMVLTRRAWRCLVHPVWIILLMLLLWCGLRALPDLGRYGVLTLRDAAMAGYALFAAMVMLCLVSEPWWLGRLTRRLAHFGANGFFAVAPLLVLLTQLGGDALPHWPGAPGPLIQLKPGDAAILACGMTCLLWLGYARWGWGTIALLVVTLLVCGALNRSGVLGFILGTGVFVVLAWSMPGVRKGVLKLLMVACLIEAVLFPLHLKLRWERHGQEVASRVSILAVTDRVLAATGVWEPVVSSSTEGLEDASRSVAAANRATLSSTVQWRLAWWRRIAAKAATADQWYRGRGFGLNLADDDGFQVTRDGSLRSPHNIHLTYLARTGFPGLGLWLALQGAWLITMARGWWQARRRGQDAWTGWFAALIGFWLAMQFNASLDVYLEGPVGAIWFWTIFGAGMAGRWMQRHDHPAPTVGCRFRPSDPA